MIPLVPPPRDLVRHGGGIPLRSPLRVVLTGDPDPAAARVFRAALAAHGVHRVDVPNADLTVHFEQTGGLSGAYRIAVTGNHVRIEGDGAGHFYAAHVLRGLMTDELPAVTVIDEPALAWRGTVGNPAWTHRERLAHLDFLGAHRMNTHVHRSPATPAELVELTARAAANHVRLVRDDLPVWTAPGGFTRAAVAAARERLGSPPVIVDELPCVPGRLPLAPYDSREPGVSAHAAGLLAAPGDCPATSTVTLCAVAEYCWDDTGFDPEAAHRRALATFAHGDPHTLLALATFADLNHRDDRVHSAQSPVLRAILAEIRADLTHRRTASALMRIAELANRLLAVPELIRRADAEFAVAADAWLTATRLWGEALGALVPVVEHGVGAARVRALVAAAEATPDPHGTVGVRLGDGILDVFVADALDVR